MRVDYVRIDRQVRPYMTREHGTGHGHRRSRMKMGVRFHLVDQTGECVPECKQPDSVACGFVRRREARATLDASNYREE